MKFMYKVPVTETYAIRSQVMMVSGVGFVGPDPNPENHNDPTPEVPMD